MSIFSTRILLATDGSKQAHDTRSLRTRSHKGGLSAVSITSLTPKIS